MPAKATKTIRIVKRRERSLADSPAPLPQTPAQIRREMVSTVLSWINDRKSSTPVVLLDTRWRIPTRAACPCYAALHEFDRKRALWTWKGIVYRSFREK